jgi:hypothetical protein
MGNTVKSSIDLSHQEDPRVVSSGNFQKLLTRIVKYKESHPKAKTFLCDHHLPESYLIALVNRDLFFDQMVTVGGHVHYFFKGRATIGIDLPMQPVTPRSGLRPAAVHWGDARSRVINPDGGILDDSLVTQV